MSADIMATESVGDMLFGILKTVITVQLSVVVLLFTLGAAAFTVHHLVIPRMSAQQHDIEKGLAAKEKAGWSSPEQTTLLWHVGEGMATDRRNRREEVLPPRSRF